MFIRLKYQRGYFLCQNHSLIPYLFTLINAHLSSNSYKFRMQPNIPIKFAGYVAWILLCKLCKFGEKIYYNSGDIEFFLGDYFFWRALYITIAIRLRYDYYTTIPRRIRLRRKWTKLRFDCDTTTIRLRRIARACFHSTRFDASKKWTCQFFVVVVS